MLELGHAIAGPFAATLLGDFGAEVIKVERPGAGDGQREMGPKLNGLGLWWAVIGRGKKSVTIDLQTAEGQRLFKDLVRTADVIVENFRPGALDRLGLGWDDLRAEHPSLIMLRISGFGQTGPYSARRGFGKIAEAFSGATNLTGLSDRDPVHPSYSLGDLSCGLMGAYGVLLAVLHRDRTGQGQMIDLALYEPLFRMIEWQIPLHNQLGVDVRRAGNQFPFAAFVIDISQTRDGHHVVFSAATLEMLSRLERLLEEEGVTLPTPRSDTALADGVRDWIAAHSWEEVLERFERGGLVAGLVYTPADLATDPHIAARRNIIDVPHERVGHISMPGVVPSLSETPGAVSTAAPELGQHTDEVLHQLLGLSAAEIQPLREKGVV